MRDSTPERDQASEVQQRYAARSKQLRQDRDLTEDARARRLAQEWKTARVELDRLRTVEQDRLADRERTLEAVLFGPGALSGVTEAISIRDAQDRASQLKTPQDAAALLQRAQQNGDQLLARAVAQHAVQRSRNAATRSAASQWDSVLGSYVDARPDMTRAVEELAQIERLNSPEVFGPYSLAQPPGVLPHVLNAATAETAGSAA